MSNDATPISPARFAEALTELPAATLRLKVLELRNDIAHLDYSNEQLQPYALGTATTVDNAGQAPAPDPDCVLAIRENLVVIERRLEQLRLVRAEIENRGLSWTAFESKEDGELQQAATAQRAAHTSAALAAAHAGSAPAANSANAANGTGSNGTSANGTAASAGEADPWTDGTFQTGTIRNGQLQIDSVAGQSFGASAAGQGGSLSDEQLERALRDRLGLDIGGNGAANNEDHDEGMHL